MGELEAMCLGMEGMRIMNVSLHLLEDVLLSDWPMVCDSRYDMRLCDR